MPTLAKIRKAVYPYPVYEAVFDDGTTTRRSFYASKRNELEMAAAGRASIMCSVENGGLLANKTLVRGVIEWNGKRWADVSHIEGGKTKRRQAKTILKQLLAYLDGDHNDDSVIDVAREAIAA